ALRTHRKVQTAERLLMGDRWPARWATLVFVTTNGTPIDPSNLRRMVGQVAVDAGIEGKVNPYDLRHTATSLMAAAGQSAERLADLLGHRDTRMVFKHYRHAITSSVTTAAEYWAASDDTTDAAVWGASQGA
ncbi:MAG: tyrosine-type recombinase/integrase, partial [Actinobacteria bacterium]|nr:tyrosine-type recombinase/integrase [Actinomycetota bacterium]